MNLLITGAGGFFGRSVINALKKLDHNFKATCVFHTHPLNLHDERFASVKCNLQDKEQVDKLIQGTKPTHLIHLAWYVAPQKFWTAEENLIWLSSSLNLFQAFCKEGGKVFIGAGSLVEYDASTGHLDEKLTPLNPTSLYGTCKKALHELILSYKNTHFPDVRVIWPRIGYFFGEAEPQDKLISKIIQSIKNQSPLKLAEPDFARAYAHVSYLGTTLANLVMKEPSEDVAFNMSSSYLYTLKEIVDFCEKTLGMKNLQAVYNAYHSVPKTLTVDTTTLEKLGLEVQDTFFNDLEKLILGN